MSRERERNLCSKQKKGEKLNENFNLFVGIFFQLKSTHTYSIGSNNRGQWLDQQNSCFYSLSLSNNRYLFINDDSTHTENFQILFFFENSRKKLSFIPLSFTYSLTHSIAIIYSQLRYNFLLH